MKLISLALLLLSIISETALADLKGMPEEYSTFDDDDFVQMFMPEWLQKAGMSAIGDRLDWRNVHGFSQAKVNGKGYLVAKEPRLNGSDYGFVIDYQKGLLYILYLDQYFEFVQGNESVLKDGKPIN